MLVVERLRARHQEADRPTLGPLSASLAPGECALLVGGNGSGKSTLLLALSGALTHHLGGMVEGTISADGFRLSATPWSEWLQRVALLPQQSHYQLSGARLTVEEEIAFPLENLGWPRPEMRRRVATVLEQFHIGQLAARLPTTLSGGEQQRVALAATLAPQPAYLLLDDPAAQLDPDGVALVTHHFRQLTACGLGLLIATAQPEPFASRAERSLLLHEGALRAQGPTRSLLIDPALSELAVIPPELTRLAQLAKLRPPWPLTLDEAATAFRTPSPNTTVPSPPTITLPATLATPVPTPVRVEGLTFAYPDFPPVLRDISLRVEPGQIAALVGPNGAGKSTLARTLNGLLRPQQGQVTIGQQRVAERPPHRLARHVAFLFQEPLDQLFNPTVREEVAFAPKQLGLSGPPLEQRIEEVLALTDLAPVAEQHPYDLSPIGQRWVALASVLAQGASVVVLDEPARGMDHPNRQRLLALLRAMRRAGYTLLLITHDMALVGELADRVLHLVEGELVADAPPAPFFAATPALRPPIAQLAHRLGYGDDITSARTFLQRYLASVDC